MDNFLYDFGDGEVQAHRHPNGGGIVADTASVSLDSFIGPDAKVYGNAVVMHNSKVKDSCKVYGSAFISDGVILEDNVEVFGSAEVKNGTYIFDNCKVSVPPKVLTGFDHPIVISDEHIIVGCHCFTKTDWKDNAAAIIRVNGYPTRTARRIHAIITEISDLHFNVFSSDDVEDHLSVE